MTNSNELNSPIACPRHFDTDFTMYITVLNNDEIFIKTHNGMVSLSLDELDEVYKLASKILQP